MPKKHSTKIGRPRLDVAGQKFGRLTAVRFLHINKLSLSVWQWECDCGALISAPASNVACGRRKSCGCLQQEYSSKLGNTYGKANGKANLVHGEATTRTTEYTAWESMHWRCENSSRKDYYRYGGRGIAVCEQWSDYQMFLADMGRKPSPKHTLGRIDNEKDYAPNNCQWETQAQQQSNRSDTRLITHEGKTMCLSHWADELGIHRETLRWRIAQGQSFEDAIKKKSL